MDVKLSLARWLKRYPNSALGCAYYASGQSDEIGGELPDSTSLRDRAASLLGCGDTDNNKINGLTVLTTDGSGVCLSDGNG